MTCKQCELLLSETGKQKELLKIATKRIKVLEQDLDDGIRFDLDRAEIMMECVDELIVLKLRILSNGVNTLCENESLKSRFSKIIKKLKGEK